MIIPFIAPLLVYLEAAFVFYPLVIALLFLSVVCLPEELSPLGDQRHNGRSPSLSMFFSILVYAAALYHFGIDVSTWKHWLPLLGIYLVIGIMWSTGKWWNFCGKVRDNLKEAVDRFTQTVEDKDNTEDVARGFMTYLTGEHSLRKYKTAPFIHDKFKPWTRAEVIDLFIPQVTAHKAVVLTWLFCWPISVLKWALADMLQDLYNGVFAAIKGAFQKIAASRFSDISKERKTVSREDTRYDHRD